MADYDEDDDQDILHIDDITKLYRQNTVNEILFSDSRIVNKAQYTIIGIVNRFFFFFVSERDAKAGQYFRIYY